MKFNALFLAATAACLSPLAAAQTANIVNNCAFPAYVSPNNGAPIDLASKAGRYSAPLTGPGSSVRMGTGRALKTPLTLEYTPNGSLIYYDLSNNAGNPFVAYRNTLNTSTAGCGVFNCGPNAQGCYSNGAAIRVETCQLPTNLTVKLCA